MKIKLAVVMVIVITILSVCACSTKGVATQTQKSDSDYPVSVTISQDDVEEVVGTEYTLYIRSDVNIRTAPSVSDNGNIIASGKSGGSNYTIIKFDEFEDIAGQEKEYFYFKYSVGGSSYEEATEENGGYVWYHIPAIYVLRNEETNGDLYEWAKAHPNEEFWIASTCSKDQDCVYFKYDPITDL